MNLNNNQLVLLDNIAYFTELHDKYINSKGKFTISSIVDGYKNGDYSTPIDMVASDDFDKIISYIEKNPALMELEVINVSETNSGTHSFCVKDSENNITVIYSGDYAYGDSWVDNFVGAVQEDSNEQENALKFFNECLTKAEVYGEIGNVTVSGHSKGGNLAQYVTIVSGLADYCLSYDGQGFSDGFMSKYADEIAANGSKITSISANYDFVHCVLNPIPNAQHYFVDVDIIPDELSVRTLAWFHMPILILDENGNILPFVEESEFSKMLHVISNSIVDIGDNDLDNMKSDLENIGTVINKVFAGEDTNKILPYIFNNEMKSFAVRMLPAITADGIISGGVAISELISDEGLRFVLEHTSEEALAFFFGDDLAEAHTDMTVDITGVFTALGEYVTLGSYYLLFGDLHNLLTGDPEGSFFNEKFDEIGDNLSYHLENLLSSWYEGMEMIGEFFGNALDSFVDWCGDVWDGVTGFFSDLFSWNDDGVIMGTNDDDNLEGTDNDNVIYGNDGDDIIEGKGGNDVIFGGKGNDEVYGGDGEDVLYGDNDNDIHYGDSGTDKLFGGLGNDELHGGADNDELFGDDGDDVLYGDSGNDKLFGGDGNDELHGGTGNDELFGGEGNDTLYGDDGDDYLESGNGNNTLYGGEGNDTLVSGEDTDYMYGGAGNDYFIGGNGSNYMYGEDGNDRMQGGEGYDYMEGGAGNDNMSGGNGYNKMYGQEGDDFIYGGNDNDYIDGGVGDDQLYGGNGNNTIIGGEGNDVIYDGNDGSHIYGGTGNDSIYAGGGNDVIDPGEGDDYIQDDHGDDTIIFKAGYGTDTISDAAGNNTIQLSGLSMSDAVMSRINGSDLKIGFGSDNIIIKQYFDGAGFQNFNINGTMINDLITTLHGSDSNDWMSAWSDNGVTIKGEGGNDTINGGNGDDTLDGGTGNDWLYGGNGNDTYIFGKDYGNDTIEDWGGSSLVKFTDINIDEVSISKLNDSTLVLTIDSTGDTLTVNGYKWNQGGYIFEFADGTTDSINKDTWKWESGFGSTAGEATQPEQNIINGTAGSDNLYGTDSNDILDGGEGNDTLCGGNGEDTYIFAKGYGNDTVNEWSSDHSVIQLKGINSDEVTITDQWGSNLILSINGTEDTLTINNFKWGQSSYTFKFADGAVGTVNKDTWELELSQPASNEISEEDVIQSNAELLSDIYSDESMSSDLLTETSGAVLIDSSSAVSAAKETEEISDQTDIQVMILTENMSAFGTENNVSDSMSISDPMQDTSALNQLLVGTQAE